MANDKRASELARDDGAVFARTHRPNYVIEAPGTEHEWTRVKCDGDGCDFYVERRGWRNWFEALDAHSAHVGMLLAAREAAARADERDRLARLLEGYDQQGLLFIDGPLPGHHRVPWRNVAWWLRNDAYPPGEDAKP